MFGAEYVVDGPLTKAEADIEEALYALSKPFAQRMETCIQRYKARRKFDAFRINIFNSYLRLGGVQTGQKQYSGGIDPKKMDDLDAEQIGLLAATDFITFNDNGGDDAQEYDVDFAFVVRGFLSYKVPYGLGIRKVPELEMACQVVRNFLNYVIYHNVCPEYIDNIKEAIELCNLAEKELVLCIHVSNLLPGSWNMACSTIYGGSYAGIFDPEATWDDTDRSLMAGLDPKMAKELILVGLNRRGTPEQIARGLDRKLTEFKHFLSLEVLEVVMPGPSPPLPENADMALPDNKYFRNTQALGYLKVTPWVAEEPFKEDQLNVEDRLRGLEIIIWLEKICLQYCFPGMHVEAKVHQFDDGLIFIDSVTGVLCSFFMRLEYPKEDKDKDGDFSD
ncbi:Argonaute complex, subunit Arb1 [Tricharina praecox]|uniref:Argonaute complex, subunit Arb1 n=1 Tax=Tricharina praecox TaxID=43433 RepID=UPI002220DA66|nr:Argonaute complex, subunit Arb1 [Tricharina praecox]KAI5847449.1 Argonaute complex, subunit Arb1 [Tricharina praecox]